MGVERELDPRKKFPSDLSPDTVLPQSHFSNNATRIANKVLRRDEVLRVKEAFTEISFRRYRSSSCRNSSGPGGLQGDVEVKRGSVYESSRAVRRMSKIGSNEARKKIECSLISDASLLVPALEPLCSSDEENVEKRHQSVYDQKAVTEECSSSGFIEIRPSLGDRKKHLAGTCEPVHRPLSDGNDLLERDSALTFHKSLSAKLDMAPPSPTSESDSYSRASAKSRFGPIKRIFDPFTKSKSQRSPLGYTTEPSNVKTIMVANMSRNQTLRKSLLPDFSHTVKASDFESQLGTKDHHQSLVACSPVHLHGCLKLETKHGVPFYEFSLNCPEEVFVAKTWKSNNACNWVYTFHSCSSRKKSNSSGWGLTEGSRESLIVGQMQVSCYLRSESSEERESDNSVVTEFVLYDVAHARQSNSTVSSADAVNPLNSGSCLGSGARKVHDVSVVAHDSNSCKQASNKDADIFSNPYPCASGVLHPGLEIAAIIVEIPFAKRESLKYKRGEVNNEKKHLNLLNLPMAEQMTNECAYREPSEKLNVVIPNGHHSLGMEGSRGPSSLLGRWRFGGGCDCGGWDMACPLTVLGNPRIRSADKQLMNKQQPLELFVQGMKEKLPAVTLTMVEKGQYNVDFHAQLSTLQAFSICVAMLHTTEASGGCGDELSKQLLECSSLKVLMEDQGKHLVESGRHEERKVPKKMQEIQRSYICKPPFSPISRV